MIDLLNQIHRMNVDDVMSEYEKYLAEEEAALLISYKDYWNMVDSMLFEMYERDLAFQEFESF